MTKRYRNVGHRIYHENIDVLIKNFPEIFNKELPKPLKVGIFYDLLPWNLMPEATLDTVLKIWTVRWEYQVALTMYQNRFDIFGKPCNEVSVAERFSAQAMINGYARSTASKAFHQTAFIIKNENKKYLRK